MTKIELLDMLTSRARVIRADREHYKRNSHMHAITEAPPQEVVDAVLAGFINDIGIMQCVDYGLYASDLAKSLAAQEAEDLPLRCKLSPSKEASPDVG